MARKFNKRSRRSGLTSKGSTPFARAIGLTGGLGSGKSTVLARFRKKGARTLDADRIVSQTLNKPAVVRQIQSVFGPGVLTKKNQLDRKKLAAIVFRKPASRSRLERLLHPIVRQVMEKSLSRTKRGLVVCDVPLLYEKGWAGDFKCVIVVEAPLNVRLFRLRKKGVAESDARKRMKAQWPMDKKVKKADFVIHNGGSIQKTKLQVDRIWAFLSSSRTGDSRLLAR